MVGERQVLQSGKNTSVYFARLVLENNNGQISKQKPKSKISYASQMLQKPKKKCQIILTHSLIDGMQNYFDSLSADGRLKIRRLIYWNQYVKEYDQRHI